MFFRSREFAILGSLEPVKPRIRECAEFGNLDSARKWSHEHAEARNLNCRWLELRRTADSGICWRPSSGASCEDIHEPGKKQSQSCSPKKSGFRVWTSGRFVNMLDEKDILVCVHIRNILRARGCYRHVKVPSSPYKRGARARVNGFILFWNLCYSQRESRSLCALTLYLNVFWTLTCVRAVIRIFRVTPQQ
jgi:hypothetical protein